MIRPFPKRLVRWIPSIPLFVLFVLSVAPVYAQVASSVAILPVQVESLDEEGMAPAIETMLTSELASPFEKRENFRIVPASRSRKILGGTPGRDLADATVLAELAEKLGTDLLVTSKATLISGVALDDSEPTPPPTYFLSFGLYDAKGRKLIRSVEDMCDSCAPEALKSWVSAKAAELAAPPFPLGIDTSPSGARISSGGEEWGETPVRRLLKPGAYKILVEMEGFETIAIEFVMPDDRPVYAEFALQEKAVAPPPPAGDESPLLLKAAVLPLKVRSVKRKNLHAKYRRMLEKELEGHFKTLDECRFTSSQIASRKLGRNATWDLDRTETLDDVAQTLNSNMLVVGEITVSPPKRGKSNLDYAYILKTYDVRGRDFIRTVEGECPRCTVTKLKKQFHEEARKLYAPPYPLGLFTQPGDARLFSQDRALGRTPFRKLIAPGQYKLRVEKEGYQNIEIEFVMPDDRPIYATFELEVDESTPPPIPEGELRPEMGIVAVSLLPENGTLNVRETRDFNEKVSATLASSKLFESLWGKQTLMVHLSSDAVLRLNECKQSACFAEIVKATNARYAFFIQGRNQIDPTDGMKIGSIEMNLIDVPTGRNVAAVKGEWAGELPEPQNAGRQMVLDLASQLGVGFVEYANLPAGSEVILNDVSDGTGPFDGSVALLPNVYVITVKLPNGQTWDHFASIEAGKTEVVSLPQEMLAGSVTVAEEKQEAVDPATKVPELSKWGFRLMAAGALVGVGGGAMSFASSRYDTRAGDESYLASTRADYRDLRDRYATYSYVAYGAMGAMLITGTVMAILGYRNDESAVPSVPAEPSSEPGVSLFPTVSPTGAGIGAALDF